MRGSIYFGSSMEVEREILENMIGGRLSIANYPTLITRGDSQRCKKIRRYPLLHRSNLSSSLLAVIPNTSRQLCCQVKQKKKKNRTLAAFGTIVIKHWVVIPANPQ